MAQPEVPVAPRRASVCQAGTRIESHPRSASVRPWPPAHRVLLVADPAHGAASAIRHSTPCRVNG
jgi:hypothetical protein